jgi:hypothetical protein
MQHSTDITNDRFAKKKIIFYTEERYVNIKVHCIIKFSYIDLIRVLGPVISLHLKLLICDRLIYSRVVFVFYDTWTHRNDYQTVCHYESFSIYPTEAHVSFVNEKSYFANQIHRDAS